MILLLFIHNNEVTLHYKHRNRDRCGLADCHSLPILRVKEATLSSSGLNLKLHVCGRIAILGRISLRKQFFLRGEYGMPSAFEFLLNEGVGMIV